MNTYFDRIIKRFESNDLQDKEIIELIEELANSGKKLTFDIPVYDFASTGGPSSLSTLLVPLYVYSLGKSVINLGVPGRPAGAIDVLSQIPGYKTNIEFNNDIINNHFYLHLEANDDYAPLDKKLFSYRKAVGKIDVPNLAIASLLAKKLSSGAQYIGLDIRVSAIGNFGKNWIDCIANAKKYNSIASHFVSNSICFLSDANNPYQEYIGRGEALEALYEIIEGPKSDLLQKHNWYCKKMAKCMVPENNKIDIMDLKSALSDNLLIQGSNYSSFLQAVEIIKTQSCKMIKAASSGYIYYNLSNIRRYLVSRQNSAVDTQSSIYPDPCGIKLLKKPGEFIYSGENVISIRNSIPSLEEKYRLYTIEESIKPSQHKEVII